MGQDAIDNLITADNIVIYDSIEELGADNADNDCREADDSDEAFGQFLIQAYKDGYGETMYVPLKNGNILAVIV